MDNTDKKKEEDKAIIEKLQNTVNELKKHPQYAQYVKQKKLHLIDSRLMKIDILLTLNVIK